VTVIEIAHLGPKPGDGDRFESGIGEALAILVRDPECLEIRAFRGIESPESFVLVITWTSIEAHEAFASSPVQADFVRCLPSLVVGDVAHYTAMELRAPADE
jgi:quinol monooxygenase YgiN